MATKQPFLWDRVFIYVNGVQYLPDGYVRGYNNTADYQSSIQHGMSAKGKGTGITVGNCDYKVSWTEYMPPQSSYVNFRTFCIANPDNIITVIPVTLVTGQQIAPQFTVQGFQPTNINCDAPSQGDAVTRTVNFIALDISNL